ncbi:uncharacterized protein LOC117764998 isoform X1 [Hippoglossus hippoglossus]|uniref:uncharacterized protein LOC117764998 isoform X1 n=1 Tax=Hippoglossus hippoglossus TaxID=8267 RepID=UPI00148D9E6D|nr:uncharacterized protein LOC117764998 isoform X1 [Hippoglossus hippoglossus]
MNAHLIFIFFFLTSLLQVGLTDSVWTGPEGGTITVSCLFHLPAEKKLFCRKSCGDGNVLIETDGVRAQSGRYSIEYEEGVFLQSHTFINVTIKQLRKSDSGNYTCGLKKTVRIDSTKSFEIIVTDASPSSTPNWTVEPSPTSFPAATAPTSNSPEPSEQSSALQKITAALLTVSFIITLSVTVMAFCRNRTNKPTECPEAPGEDEVEREYEEVGDGRVNSSSSEEQFQLYSLAQSCNTTRLKTTPSHAPTLRWTLTSVTHSTAPPIDMFTL